MDKSNQDKKVYDLRERLLLFPSYYGKKPAFVILYFVFYFLLGIWVLGFGIFPISNSYAVPVYTDTTYPQITVIETTVSDTEYYKVSINDLEGDSLFDIAYAWGTKPHVYAYVSVAGDDTANWVFSHAESLRWEYIQKKVVERWDKATYNKHPMEFTFLKNPFIIDYTKQQILDSGGLGWLRLWSELKLEEENYITLKMPYIYICLDGGNYFYEVGESSNSSGSINIATIYLGLFDDSVRNDTVPGEKEFIDCVGVHELCHPFVKLPNIQPFFDSWSHYNYVIASKSPTLKPGYFEVYDPLNYMANNQSCSRDLFCAPLSEMCLGTRSKYEDKGITLQGGTMDMGTWTEEWTYYYDTTSSKYFYEQADEGGPVGFWKGYWNLHWNSPKYALDDSTREVLIPKAEQDNRSLLVFASDSLHTGYFKCYSLGAKSTVSVIDNPTTSIGMQIAEFGMRNSPPHIPNPCRDVKGLVKLSGRDVAIYDFTGKRVKICDVKAGIYVVRKERWVEKIMICP